MCVVPFHATEANDDDDGGDGGELPQARCKYLEMQRVGMNGLIGRTPSVSHANGGEWWSFQTALACQA